MATLITTPVIAAAFRLATTLPARTHRRQDQAEVEQVYRPRIETQRIRREQIRRWLGEKPTPTRKEMGTRLGISDIAIGNYIRAMRAEGEKI